MGNKAIAVYIRFDSHIAGFILPDDCDTFRKYMNQEISGFDSVNEKCSEIEADNIEISKHAFSRSLMNP